MAANKRYQIFVSSTQADLRTEREAIINELTKVGYIAVGMEQFPATDEEQMDFIRPVIDESDYYVVVIKGRYGSVGNDKVSYTEKEFRYAIETKKPAMAFLYKDVGALRVNETDNDPEQMRKLSAFRAELEQKRIVKHWLTADELVAQVKDSVNDMVRRRPATGWIRGDQAFDPEVYKEIEKLRKENESLRALSSNPDAAVRLPSNISHGDDKFVINYLTSNAGIPILEGVSGTFGSQFELSYDAIIRLFADGLFGEASERNFEQILGQHLKKVCRLHSIRLDPQVTKALRFQFEALGIINAILSKEKDEIVWKLTEKGRAYVARLNANHRS